ncbi:TrmB family transcriptional regulator [Natronobacterium texcoconense]|uniref:Sugar-specific transcriptional regulator TrmB n=1 Tax=Natronobacterium texcoconense TaxID=1095778 RepID=A0A1H1GMU0_NATTX|nr:TrmB family transcriptional regulator [Natronobacterium texcoconense]SDR14403.1 Sugar-specific transcriptional regulator TrmB [Natronobacterium texcoconense]
MDRTELTETLEDAGLSPYQADAFVTLLELGSASATDVAQASSVPDPRIYDVLRGLEEEGYVETYEQDSLHARAHDPADVLADLRTRANRFETAADEIEDRWSRPDLEEHKVSIVKRLDTVLTRADELIRSATNQVQIGLTPHQFADLEDALEEATENGVDVKVCLFPSLGSDPSLPGDDVLARTCTEARHRAIPSPFVALIDRSWTCFSPHGGSTNEYGVIVNDRTHAYVFNWYFQTCLWEVHETIYSSRSDEPPITYVDLRHCLRDVVPLLEGGHEIEATIRGFETGTGHGVTQRGRIVDVTYAGISASDDRGAPLSQLAGEASLTLATDDETYTVGGWGAMIEDFEATRITIESID